MRAATVQTAAQPGTSARRSFMMLLGGLCARSRSLLKSAIPGAPGSHDTTLTARGANQTITAMPPSSPSDTIILERLKAGLRLQQ